MLFTAFSNYAQVSNYSFSSATETYTEIAGGTTLWSASFDDATTSITIPSFLFAGNNYTSIWISTNGFITFGQAPATANYNPISSTENYSASIAGFSKDIVHASSGNPSIKYATIGNEIVVQWKDVRGYGSGFTSEIISFQIRLNIIDYSIKIVYGGTISQGGSVSYTQIGLRGGSNIDFKNLDIISTGSWVSPVQGSANNNNCYFSSIIKPLSGLTYKYSPCSSPPSKPGTPIGNLDLCAPYTNTTYTTSGAIDATSYVWLLNPVNAGTITGTGTTASVIWNNAFSGIASISVSGTNSSCNNGTASDSIQITLWNSSHSSFNLSSPINGGWTSKTPLFQWAVSTGTTSYNLYIDGNLKKSNIPATSYHVDSTETVSSGMHTWNVVARNGCSTESNETWSFRVDNTQPTAFSLVSPTDNSWTANLQPTFSWGASSDVNSGLAKYQLWIDGTLNRDNIATTSTSTTPTLNLTNGSHTWEIRAVDNVGNVRNSTQIWTVKVDNMPPTTTIDLDNFESGKFNNVMWIQDGNTSWAIDSSTKYEGNYAAKSGLISDNQTTDLKLNLNNISGTTISFYYKVSSEPNYDYLYFKENSIYYGIWSGEIGWTKATYDLAAGTNTFTWSYEKDGGVATGSDCAWIDKICMTSLCKLRTPLNQQYLSSKLPTFSWGSAPDPGIGFDKFQLFIDGNLVKDNLSDSTWTVTSPLAYGVHTWYVKGFDLLGNNQSSYSSIFYVDNARPNVFNLTSPINNQIVNLPTPNFTWQATTDSIGGNGMRKYQLLINEVINRDSINIAQTTVAPKNALAQGVYTWFIKAYDNLGNVRQSTQTNTFYVDWEDPTAFTLITPLDNSTLTVAIPEFKWHKSTDVGSGISKYELNITGQTPITILPSDTSKIITTNLPNGPYTWYVKAYDVAGGFTSSNTQTFTINAIVSGLEQSELNSTIKVYPNPVGNELFIESAKNERMNFEIINSIGQVVYRGILLDKTVVQTSGFNSGIYIIKLENGKTYEFKKILKK